MFSNLKPQHRNYHKRPKHRFIHTRALALVAVALSLMLVGSTTGRATAAPLASPAATIVVDRNDDTAAASACTAAPNDCSLRGAIIFANANPGTVITLPAGTYTLTIPGNDNAAMLGDLDINASVTLNGAGSGTTLITTNYTNSCGDCKVFGINQDGTHNDLAVSISGVTVSGGFNNGAAFCGTFFETGGGIDDFMSGAGGSLTLSDVIISNNKTTGCVNSYGGGLNVDTVRGNAGTVTLTNVQIIGNTADSVGGGINFLGDSPSLTLSATSVISGNVSLGAGGNAGDGGGLNIQTLVGGAVSMHGVTIANNTAKGRGGGVNLTPFNKASLTMDNTGGASSLTGNTSLNFGTPAVNPSQGGGLAKADTATTTLTNVTISGNHADNAGTTGNAPQGGGIFVTGNAALTMSGGSLSNNTANDAGNNKGDGGALAALHTGGSATLSGVSISGNTARVSGGGVYVNGAGGTTTLNNISTFSGNSAPTGSGVNVVAGTLSCTNAVAIGDDVNIAGGTFTATSGTLSLGSSFTRASGGSFNHNNGTVLWNGAGAQNINGTATSETFNHFTVNKSGGTLSVGGSTTTLALLGNVLLTAGTFDAGTATAINVGGNWTNNGGTFTPGSSTVTFNGSGAQGIGGASPTTFNGLTINNSGPGVTLGNNQTANGLLTLSTDLTTTNGFTLTLGANPATAGGGDVWGNSARNGAFVANTTYSFGNPNVSVKFTSGTPSTFLKFNLQHTVPPASGFSNAVQRFYSVASTGGAFVATLRLHYQTAELNGNVPASLLLWRFSGGWVLVPTTATDGASWVESNNVSSFSPWVVSTLGPQSPTAVTISEFEARSLLADQSREMALVGLLGTLVLATLATWAPRRRARSA